MKIRINKIIGYIIDLLFPPKCVSCDIPVKSGIVLCDECMAKYASEQSCGTEALNDTELKDIALPITYLTYYDPSCSGKRVTERIILSLKDRRNVLLADLFARDMAKQILADIRGDGNSAEDYRLTYIPRSEKNCRKYGFDQGELLCERIGRYTGIPMKKLIVRKGGMEQKKMGYDGRLHNAASTLSYSGNTDICSKRIIIVDDILTTGATFVTAAKLLLDGGCESVRGVFIAKTRRSRGGMR